MSKDSARRCFPEDRKKKKKGHRGRQLPEHAGGGVESEGKTVLTRWMTGS